MQLFYVVYKYIYIYSGCDQAQYNVAAIRLFIYKYRRDTLQSIYINRWRSNYLRQVYICNKSVRVQVAAL